MSSRYCLAAVAMRSHAKDSFARLRCARNSIVLAEWWMNTTLQLRLVRLRACRNSRLRNQWSLVSA
eukprot:3458-Heterococcus_DN1.PRE.1